MICVGLAIQIWISIYRMGRVQLWQQLNNLFEPADQKRIVVVTHEQIFRRSMRPIPKQLRRGVYRWSRVSIPFSVWDEENRELTNQKSFLMMECTDFLLSHNLRFAQDERLHSANHTIYNGCSNRAIEKWVLTSRRRNNSHHGSKETRKRKPPNRGYCLYGRFLVLPPQKTIEGSWLVLDVWEWQHRGH